MKHSRILLGELPYKNRNLYVVKLSQVSINSISFKTAIWLILNASCQTFWSNQQACTNEIASVIYMATDMSTYVDHKIHLAGTPDSNIMVEKALTKYTLGSKQQSSSGPFNQL